MLQAVILYTVRLLWITSQIAVLIGLAESRVRYRCFAAYMVLSMPFSLLYWPELLPGWDAVMAPYLVAILLLRTLACLEALHFQTGGFPQWPRMMAGAFLTGFFVLLLLAGVRDNRWAGLLVEYRRYLQIWTMVVTFVVELTLLERGWFTRWPLMSSDPHAWILFGLALNHGLVSWWAMSQHPGAAAWFNLNLASTAIDAALYAAWTLAVPAAVSGSNRSPLRPSAQLRSASSATPTCPLSRAQ